MLGGGGMAIPMALLSLCDEMMEVEEIHVVELHQVATWSEEIWRVKRCDLNDDDEIPLELPFQNLHVSIFFHIRTYGKASDDCTKTGIYMIHIHTFPEHIVTNISGHA